MNVKNTDITQFDCFEFSQSETLEFIRFLQKKAEVIAPHKKGEVSFVYKPVEQAQDVVLDYPRTIQPLKKFFLPPQEALIKFDRRKQSFEKEAVVPKERIFFAIHSYEMQSIKCLDYSFNRDNPESQYLTRREKSLFIGISFTPDEYHFSKSVGIEIEQTDGFCLFFEPHGDGHWVFIINQDGERLMQEFGGGKAVQDNVQIDEKDFNNKIKLHFNRLPQVFDYVYNSPVWEKVAKKCVGCGTCNLLCPTCYCFDVRDEVELDMVQGERYRFWDGCMLNEFAEVAGGENFRDKFSQRTRHRLYRKFKYITELSGELHCVGCGRCTKYCPANISIVQIINDLIDDYATQQKKQLI
ncbi:MAG TPA: hypothetical protein EYP36_01980 [Calditrichaeota bacterium]|nr:hypothetical protein [Calditrichota bacterium]